MKNKYEIRGDVTAIFILSKGRVYETQIDTDDLENVKQFGNLTLKLGKRGYNYAIMAKNDKKYSVHRVVTDAPPGKEVDHINHNTLDNRKINLRIVSRRENQQNRGGVNRNNTSGVINVNWSSRHDKWVAGFVVNGDRIHVGYFAEIEEAKIAVAKARAALMPTSKEKLEFGETGMTRVDFPHEDRPRKSNKHSGVRGVHRTFYGTWLIHVKINGKTECIGRLKDKMAAVEARDTASQIINEKGYTSLEEFKNSIHYEQIFTPKNRYEVREGVGIVTAKYKGGDVEFYVDETDLEFIKSICNSWNFRTGKGTKYVVGMVLCNEERRKREYLHRVLLNPPNGFVIDHINGDTMDNRRANLRVVTQGQNAQNITVRRNTMSGVRGVTWSKSSRKWKAVCRVNGKSVYIGMFDTIEEAKVAVEKARSVYQPYATGSSKADFNENVFRHKNTGAPRSDKKTPAERGIYWKKKIKRWEVTIFINKQRHYIGCFKEYGDAVDALHNYKSKVLGAAI